MATKTYFSKSDISISVLINGKGAHLSFMPISGGGSVFTTEDEKIQTAIEKHHNFGRLFKLRSGDVPKKTTDKKEKVGKSGDKLGSNEGEDTDNSDSNNDGKTVITVSCPDDAKDYLADTFGVSRTTMKTVKSIKAIAESKNIEFSGI